MRKEHRQDLINMMEAAAKLYLTHQKSTVQDFLRGENAKDPEERIRNEGYNQAVWRLYNAGLLKFQNREDQP